MWLRIIKLSKVFVLSRVDGNALLTVLMASISLTMDRSTLLPHIESYLRRKKSEYRKLTKLMWQGVYNQENEESTWRKISISLVASSFLLLRSSSDVKVSIARLAIKQMSSEYSLDPRWTSFL